jgi:hypothetical protein
MKMNGQILDARFRKTVPFRRKDTFVKFELASILSRKKFNEYCPLPVPPQVLDNKGNLDPFNEDPTYKAKVKEYNDCFKHWHVIETITEASNIKWDKVKETDPKTWHFWEEELAEAGISEGERDILIRETYAVNALTNNNIDEAMNDFLAMLAKEIDAKNAASKESLPKAAEPKSTSSSDAASDSASTRPEPEKKAE